MQHYPGRELTLVGLGTRPTHFVTTGACPANLCFRSTDTPSGRIPEKLGASPACPNATGERPCMLDFPTLY